MQPLPVTASLNFNLEGSVKCVQSGVGWIFPTGQCLVHETLRRIGWLVFTCLSWYSIFCSVFFYTALAYRPNLIALQEYHV